ncbi:MAG TPA: hypothetical protein VKF41_03520 [Bryobacteraceae bacterium]|nr:hypothetical protein [Bryobacteraceae bacterium]
MGQAGSLRRVVNPPSDLFAGVLRELPPSGGVQYQWVDNMRFRWFLPACNIAIDIILLVVLVHVAYVRVSRLRHPPPLWQQEYQYIDPGLLSEGQPPEPLKTIIAGTFPAALIASLPLNNGWWTSSPFDVRWASLYLVLASALWYAVGRWAETGHPRAVKLAKLYVLMRALSVPLSMSWRGSVWTALSQLLLFAVWIAVVLYVVLRTAWILCRGVRSRLVRTA